MSRDFKFWILLVAIFIAIVLGRVVSINRIEGPWDHRSVETIYYPPVSNSITATDYLMVEWGFGSVEDIIWGF